MRGDDFMNKTPFDLQDHVAIVTGGGTGIGRAISEALALSGAHVVICSRKMEHLEPVEKKIEELGRQSLAISCDVRKEEQVKEVVEQTAKKFGRLDILVNNAGASFVCPVEDVSLNGWNAIFGINATGTFLFSKYGCQEMKKQDKGVIINIASIAGRDGAPMMAAYGAAKAAVINFTKALAVEFAQYNIRVNCIAPGMIITEAVQEQMHRSRTGTNGHHAGIIPGAVCRSSHSTLGESGRNRVAGCFSCIRGLKLYDGRDHLHRWRPEDL
jgi:NAD(P)-dependent dehydrogenase (short-subunit alcohol dehydrogenase family)